MKAGETVTETPDNPGDEPVDSALVDDTEAETDDSAAEESGGDDEAASGEEDDEDDATDALLTKEEAAEIGDDVKALRKRLNQAFTQKTQKLSGAANFLQALEKDPEGVTRALMARVGIVANPQAPGVTVPAGPKPMQVLAERLKGLLGEDLAKDLTPIIADIAKEVAKEQTKGLEGALTRQVISSAESQAQLEKETFFAKYPDAEAMEQAMVDVARSVLPAQGSSVQDYYEVLYAVAKARKGGKPGGAKVADAVKRMIASAGAGERPKSGGTPKTVASAAPERGKMSKSAYLRASLEAASKGIRWEKRPGR